MSSNIFIFAIGFLAQLLFSARILVQWILSEKAKRVLSPSIFWILSICASYLLCIYGWLRMDFSIILGQFISYYIYIWNLKAQNVLSAVPYLLKLILLLTPVVALLFLLHDINGFKNDFFHNDNIPLNLLIFGSIGQVVFTLRFIYQWIYSYKRHVSLLPAGFWIISLIGSAIILIYGFIRMDPVLLLGQSVGVVAYSRNLYIGYRQSKEVLPYEK